MSDTQTVGQRTLSQKARSNARFLRDNFYDLHGPEADTVASKLEECADHIEKLEKQLAERDAALARCVEILKTAECPECHGVGFTIEEWFKQFDGVKNSRLSGAETLVASAAWDAGRADLEKQLAERDAALARCVGAFRMLHDEMADYIFLNNLGDPHKNQSMRMARDALASLPASAQATANVQQWQPIETAPKDDNKHVLLFGDGPAIRECCYVGYLSPARVNDSGIDEWKEMASGYVMRPTNWMPLPEPPTEAIREEKEGK